MKWYLLALRRSFSFAGRSSRREYWFFTFVNLLIYVLMASIDAGLGVFDSDEMLGTWSSIYLLAVFLPTLSLSVRRLHDVDRSGWWFLITLVPWVGAFALLAFMALKGTVGRNRYGLGPAAATNDYF